MGVCCLICWTCKRTLPSDFPPRHSLRWVSFRISIGSGSKTVSWSFFHPWKVSVDAPIRLRLPPRRRSTPGGWTSGAEISQLLAECGHRPRGQKMGWGGQENGWGNGHGNGAVCWGVSGRVCWLHFGDFSFGSSVQPSKGLVMCTAFLLRNF